MDLNQIAVFARVARSGSFTTAARELRMPKSTVSRKVSALEAHLGARLLQRTTRKLSLTDVGRTYYAHCARIVGEIEEAERAVTSLQETPRGRLRVTAPLNFDFLGPLVATFLARHLEVEVEMVCTDRVVGLVEEGFDLAVRVGRLADSTLVARPLARMRAYLVASPGYLKKHGRPASPRDLPDHDCILFAAGTDRGVWRLRSGEEEREVAVRARLTVNDLDVLHDAVTGGLGVGMLPAHRCVSEIRARKLERVLADWCSPEATIHAVHPSARHLSPAMKAFVDHLQRGMTPPPWELGPRP